MAAKVNLKKYLPIDGRWQFAPLAKVRGWPQPDIVLIGGKAVRGTGGTFYLEWRENGRRIQRPCGTSPGEALDQWAARSGLIAGTSRSAPKRGSVRTSGVSIQTACEQFLAGIAATRAPSTHKAYDRDLTWFGNHVRRTFVSEVGREDLIGLFALGREQKFSQRTINRAVMVGLMALRDAGAKLELKKGDWPKIAERDVVTYTPGEIAAFLRACSAPEGLLFQVYLQTGFRNREVSTLRWRDIDVQRSTLAVCARPELGFAPKSYECRKVRVPASLIALLKAHRNTSSSALVFPTPPHPRRPNYGGDRENAHHLEMLKTIAYNARLNCGLCIGPKGQCSDGPHCQQWFLHKWRHTYATNMLQSGIDIRTLQILLGHKQLSVTEKYLRALRLDEIEAQVESSRLAAYLIPPGPPAGLSALPLDADL